MISVRADLNSGWLICTTMGSSFVNLNSSKNEKKNGKLLSESPQISDDFVPPPAVPNENLNWDFSNGTMLGFIYERYNDTEYYK